MKTTLAVGLFASIALHAAAAQTKTITFVVDKSKVRLSAQLTAANLTADGKATVVAHGDLFEPPRLVDLQAPWHLDQSTPLAAAENYHRALLAATDEQIAAFWAADERAGVLRQLAIPEYKKRVRDIFGSVPQLRVLAVLNFSETAVVFISHTKLVLGVNVHKRDGKWYVTNVPSNDVAVAIAEAALAAGTARASQP